MADQPDPDLPAPSDAREQAEHVPPDPPALPHRTADITLLVAVGTALWLVGAIVIYVAHLVAGVPLDIWFATCLVGGALGGVGYGIFAWQRSAARRGSRLAQRGLD